MRDLSPLVEATKARDALVDAVGPFMIACAATLPDELPASDRVLVIVQPQPLMVRLLTFAARGVPAFEAARAWGDRVPNGRAITEAAERFIAAGLSAMPDAGTETALEMAANPKGGFVVTLDILTGAVKCIVPHAAGGLDRGVELFSIAPEVETVH